MLSDGDQKKRLEHGVWLDEVDRMYRAWRAASAAEKNNLLLTGLTLTWAESWRLTNPSDFSPAAHTYIARSVAAQALKASTEREKRDAETRRRDRVYQQILLLMALFAIVILAPGALRLYLRAAEPLVSASNDTRPAGDPIAVAVTQNAPLASDVTEPMASQDVTPLGPLALTVQAKRALQEGAPDRARRLALEAVHRAPRDRLPLEALSMLVTLTEKRAPLPWDRAALTDAEARRVCVGGQRLAEAGDRLWRLDPVRGVAAPLPARTASARPSAFDATCRRTLVTNDDYDVMLLDVASGAGQETRSVTFGRHNATVIDMRFSANGNRAVSVARDGDVYLWNVDTGRRVAAVRPHAESPAGATLDADGSQLVTWTENGLVELWNATTGALQGAFEGNASPLLSAEFTADGATLLTVAVEGTATLWNTRTRRPDARMRPEQGAIVEAWLSANGRHVVARLDEGRLQVWSLAGGRSLAVIETQEGHTLVETSPNGDLLATADRTGRVAVFDLRTGAKRFEVEAGAAVLALTFEGEAALIATTAQANVHWSLPVTPGDAVRLVDGQSYCATEPRLPWCPPGSTTLASPEAPVPFDDNTPEAAPTSSEPATSNP